VHVDIANGCRLLQLFVNVGKSVLQQGLLGGSHSTTFGRVAAQVFGTLRSFAPWIQSKLSAASSEMTATLTNIIELVIGVLTFPKLVRAATDIIRVTNRSGKTSLVGQSASILLGTLGKVLPLMQLPQIQTFVKQVPQLLLSLKQPIQIELCGAILTTLLVPVGDAKQVNWEERMQQTMTVFQSTLFDPYVAVVAAPDFVQSGRFSSPEVLAQVKHITCLTSTMFQRCFSLEKRTKQIFFQTSQKVIQVTLSLFKPYLQYPGRIRFFSTLNLSLTLKMQ
jgi:hypothetical protein